MQDIVRYSDNIHCLWVGIDKFQNRMAGGTVRRFVFILQSLPVIVPYENIGLHGCGCFYSQRCVDNKCPIDNTLQILQSTSSIVPTCELYCDIGDIWLLKKDTTQAEMCYHIAASMLPYRLTPKYKTFLLYVNQGNRKSAIDIGEKILNQPVKKEGTKTLRIKAEIIQYMQNCRESVNNTKE